MKKNLPALQESVALMGQKQDISLLVSITPSNTERQKTSKMIFLFWQSKRRRWQKICQRQSQN